MELRVGDNWPSLQLKWIWDWYASFMGHKPETHSSTTWSDKSIIDYECDPVGDRSSSQWIYLWQNVLTGGKGPFLESRNRKAWSVWYAGKGRRWTLPSYSQSISSSYADCCLESGKINVRPKEPTLTCGVTLLCSPIDRPLSKKLYSLFCIHNCLNALVADVIFDFYMTLMVQTSLLRSSLQQFRFVKKQPLFPAEDM